MTAIDYRLFHYSVYEGHVLFIWNNSFYRKGRKVKNIFFYSLFCEKSFSNFGLEEIYYFIYLLVVHKIVKSFNIIDYFNSEYSIMCC